MIQELLLFGATNNLTGRESVRTRPIHWVIDLAHDGQVLKISPTLQELKKRGKRYSVPRNYHLQVVGNEAKSVGKNQGGWLPNFLFGKLSDYMSLDAPQKESQEKKRLFITQSLIQKASKDLPEHEGLRAVLKFISAGKGLNALGLTKEEELAPEYKKLLAGQEQLTFRYNTELLAHDAAIQKWWSNYFRSQRDLVMNVLPTGYDLNSGIETGIPAYHPIITGKTSLVSFDKAPFWSFGLGKLTASMGIETSETISAALAYLWGSKDNHISLGEVMVIFWAAGNDQTCPVGFVSLIESPDSLSVRDFINSVWGCVAKTAPTARFNFAMFTQNEGRIIPIYWNTSPISEVENRLISYFRSIELPWHPEFSKKPECYGGSPPPIGLIAKALVRKSPEAPPPAEIYALLMRVALFDRPFPGKLLRSALNRQRAEITKGPAEKSTKYEIGPFEHEQRLRARTALVKLFFELNNKKGEQITMENHHSEKDSGYLCGRLLALLDKIHIEAHAIRIEKGGKKIKISGTNTSPANRSYAAASTTPAIIFPQLCKLVRYHLNKIGGSWAYRLEHGYQDEVTKEVTFEGLKQVVNKLQESSEGRFPGVLSLEQQGRFAIGFYFERCRIWPEAEKTLNSQNGQQEKVTDPNIME